MDHLKYSKQTFNNMADSQEEKGIKKYGQALNPLDDYDWLNMCAEEMTDGYKYLVAEQVKREYIVNQIREIIKLPIRTIDSIEINALLDQLEGK